MPAIQWTQDRPARDRLYFFVLPTGRTNPPLAPESRMSRMRFVGSWQEAAAMGAFRSLDSEPIPADLPDALMVWWPAIMTSSHDWPQRAEYYASAKLRIDDLKACRTSDRRAWWELLTGIREDVSGEPSASDPGVDGSSADPSDWSMPSQGLDPG